MNNIIKPINFITITISDNMNIVMRKGVKKLFFSIFNFVFTSTFNFTRLFKKIEILFG